MPERLGERIVVRFGATLAANLLRAGLSLLTGVMLARGLGASGLGDLFFLLGSFTAVNQFIDLGSSTAFYTFLSHRRRGRTFFALYFGWLAVQFLVTSGIVMNVLSALLVDRIWVGHQRAVIWLAFGASFVTTQVWGVVSQLGEARRKTVAVQTVAVLQAALHAVLVALGVRGGWLTVPLVMWLLIGEYLLLIAVIAPLLVRENLTASPAAPETLSGVLREFVQYCRPLVAYATVSCLYLFTDRWLLQRFGGAQQQGFFAIGQQFAAISLIATASILRIFWKEIAEAYERHDHQRIKRLYETTSRGLYVVGAWMSGWLIPYSREILLWTVGPAYEAAWPVLALMLLYPVHQSMGQVRGAYFYATRATTDYTRIGLIMMGLSILVTYVCLAPPSARWPGLGWGAVGLAAKMVGLQIIGVSLQARVIARTWGFAHDHGRELSVLALWCGLGWAGKWIGAAAVHLLALGSERAVVLIGGGLYLAASLGVFFVAPAVMGLTRGQVAAIVERLRDPSRLLAWRTAQVLHD